MSDMECRIVIEDMKITSKYSLNARYFWANQHKLKQEVMAHTVRAIKRAKLEAVRFVEPVTIEINYNTGLDIDNHGLVSKAIIDALKTKKIIKDDSKRYVKSLIQNVYNGNGIEVVIRVSEVG